MKYFLLENIEDIIPYNVAFVRILSCLNDGFNYSDLQVLLRYLSGEKQSQRKKFSVQVMFDRDKLLKLIDKHESFLKDSGLDITTAKADLSTAIKHVNILTDVDSDAVSDDMVVSVYPRIKKIIDSKIALSKDAKNGENIDVQQKDFFGYFKDPSSGVNIVTKVPLKDLPKLASIGITSSAATSSIALAGTKDGGSSDADTTEFEPYQPSGTINPSNIRISERGIRAIQAYEGFKQNAYKDGNGYSIGFGVGVKNPNMGPITREQADSMMRRVVGKFEQKMRSVVKVPVTQNQWDALVSFAYNVGFGNFKKSTLLKKLNSKDYAGAASEFPRWVKSQGRTLSGLSERRSKEQKMFLA